MFLTCVISPLPLNPHFYARYNLIQFPVCNTQRTAIILATSSPASASPSPGCVPLLRSSAYSTRASSRCPRPPPSLLLPRPVAHPPQDYYPSYTQSTNSTRGKRKSAGDLGIRCVSCSQTSLLPSIHIPAPYFLSLLFPFIHTPFLITLMSPIPTFDPLSLLCLFMPPLCFCICICFASSSHPTRANRFDF